VTERGVQMDAAVLDRGPDAPPLYRQLGRELLRVADDLGPGTRFPSERELIERYQVSRITVQQALGDLVRSGTLIRQQGRGTFVSRPKVERPRAQMNSFSEDMRQKGLKPDSKLLGYRQRTADGRLAEMLGLEDGDQVVHLDRLMLADGEPMAVHQTFLRADLLGVVIEQNIRTLESGGSLYQLIESLTSLRLADADETVEATSATQSVAAALGIEPGDPVLWIVRHTFTEEGAPVEVSEMTYRGDRYRLGLRSSRPRA
jgi:GntR family transcriptional regulator